MLNDLRPRPVTLNMQIRYALERYMTSYRESLIQEETNFSR